MDTLRIKFDNELFDLLQKNGYKVEWLEFEESDETNELLEIICSDDGEIYEEFSNVQATFEELKNRGIYDYLPTFEWQINYDYWYKSAVYEIVKIN